MGMNLNNRLIVERDIVKIRKAKPKNRFMNLFIFPFCLLIYPPSFPKIPPY
jgi:hypothetical protein